LSRKSTRNYRTSLIEKECVPKCHPPPDPEKGSPAGTDIHHGAKRISKKTQQKNIKPRKARQATTRDLALYSGRELLGHLKATATGRFVAILPEGVMLGHFRTLRAAAAAIGKAHGGDHA
jgi:hypothetical protein